jgi:hypothetical protein
VKPVDVAEGVNSYLMQRPDEGAGLEGTDLMKNEGVGVLNDIRNFEMYGADRLRNGERENGW